MCIAQQHLSSDIIFSELVLLVSVIAEETPFHPLTSLGFSIVGMLIGFQCVPEPQEEVAARHKKRN